jgi:hypothetical protein
MLAQVQIANVPSKQAGSDTPTAYIFVHKGPFADSTVGSTTLGSEELPASTH